MSTWSTLFGCLWLNFEVLIQIVPPSFQNSVDLENVMQLLDITDQSLIQEAKEIIRFLVTPNQNLYSLLFNNCRDNTNEISML